MTPISPKDAYRRAEAFRAHVTRSALNRRPGRRGSCEACHGPLWHPSLAAPVPTARGGGRYRCSRCAARWMGWTR